MRYGLIQCDVEQGYCACGAWHAGYISPEEELAREQRKTKKYQAEVRKLKKQLKELDKK